VKETQVDGTFRTEGDTDAQKGKQKTIGSDRTDSGLMPRAELKRKGRRKGGGRGRRGGFVKTQEQKKRGGSKIKAPRKITSRGGWFVFSTDRTVGPGN